MTDPIRLAARIYRSIAGRFFESVDDVIAMSEFDEFLGCSADDCRQLTPVFDVDFYLSQVPRAQRADINPVLDFCGDGARLGRRPHVLFDTDYISWQAGTGLEVRHPAEALIALLENDRRPWLSPHVLFEPEVWIASGSTPTTNPTFDFLSSGDFGYRHFSRYFCARFYRKNCPEVALSRQNPLIHYLSKHGSPDIPADPNPMLHGIWYEQSNRPVVGDTLSHFVKSGARAGLMPNPYAEDEIGFSAQALSTEESERVLLDYIECPGRSGKQ